MRPIISTQIVKPSFIMRKEFNSLSAFTLIELLTVIAIIGILAGILIPTVGAVKTSANKSKTKAQFSQWATGMSLFKQEYGYYPAVNNGNKIDAPKFIGALSATDYLGVKITSSTDARLAGNKKRISFYSFSDSDILTNSDGTPASAAAVIDAFRNSDIAIFIDTDGDGKVSPTSVQVVPGNSIDGTGIGYSPSSAPGDVRAGVAFYSAGRGDGNKDIVYSWK